MKLKILLLAEKTSPLYNWLLECGEEVIPYTEKITADFINKNGFNFLISYGYRFILKKEILSLFENKAINLHISYLPYNKGADPNFWSFIDNTPKGVSIHYIDEGIDTGKIIVQKKIEFDESIETLKSSYEKLQNEIEDLFYKNWELIKSNRIVATPQKEVGTVHSLKDKNGLLHLLKKNGWDTKVSELSAFKNSNKS